MKTPIAAIVAVAVCAAPEAAASPGPFVSGTTADCAGQTVPLDPPVSVHDPVGTSIFDAFLALCAGSHHRRFADNQPTTEPPRTAAVGGSSLCERNELDRRWQGNVATVG